MKIGIFGGTFDPIHTVHLKIAASAAKQLGLDRLYFVPAYAPPHKQSQVITPVRHRLNMIRLAIQPIPMFKISLYEIQRKKLSYTIDTISYFRKRFPSAEIYLIIGSDMLRQFHTWRNPENILSLATLAVYERAGYNLSPDSEYPFYRIAGTRYALSATKIRTSIEHGKNVEKLLPKAVFRYVKDKELYVH